MLFPYGQPFPFQMILSCVQPQPCLVIHLEVIRDRLARLAWRGARARARWGASFEAQDKLKRSPYNAMTLTTPRE